METLPFSPWLLPVFGVFTYYLFRFSFLAFLAFIHWKMPPKRIEELRKTLKVLNQGKFWNRNKGV